MQLDLDVSNAIQSQGENTWRLLVPAFLPDTAASSLTSRQTPVHFGAYTSIADRLSATLPAGLHLTQAPAAFDVDQPCLRARRRSEVKGQQVTITLDYTRRCADVSVADYAAFRQAALDIQRQLRDEIVFTTGASK